MLTKITWVPEESSVALVAFPSFVMYRNIPRQRILGLGPKMRCHGENATKSNDPRASKGLQVKPNWH